MIFSHVLIRKEFRRASHSESPSRRETSDKIPILLKPIIEANKMQVKNPSQITKGSALKFVILLGVVSLLADMTYEGARSVTGPYLEVLGASATAVGFFAGLGELIGYGLRIFTGLLADKTHKYWTITITGYCINLFAVPMLALAGNWQVAVLLMMLERTGKAIRTPARDAMLSHGTQQTGRGWGFGLHEAMDQIGAMTGPLIVSLVLFVNGGYKSAFVVLLIPALLAIAFLLLARALYPRPQDLEVEVVNVQGKGFPKVFWILLSAAALLGAGYADFPLIAFHFQKVSLASESVIPIFYAVAMGVDAIAALAFGKMFDRFGVPVLILATALSMFFAPLVFWGGFGVAMIGAAVWGIGMGAQESIMRASIPHMVSANRRGSAYGLFNTGYGLFWFAGSSLMGVLYDISIPALVAFSMAAQFAAIPLLLIAARKENKEKA